MSAPAVIQRLRLEDILPAVVAAAVAVVHVLIALDGGNDGVAGVHSTIAAVLAVLFVPVLLFWRRRPLATAAAVVLLLALWEVNWLWALPGNMGVTPLFFAAPLVVYSATRHGRPARAGVVVLLVMLVGAILSPLLWRFEDGVAGATMVYDPLATLDWLLIQWALLVMVFFVARSRRHAAAQARELEDARMRIAEDRQAAVRERERALIAREIHDVLAHSLTLINVQAGAGQVSGAQDAALQGIRETSSAALAEVRGIVRALRSSDGPSDGSGTEPTAGLAQVPDLLRRFTEAGLVIEEQLPDGAGTDVPQIVQLAVQRVLAESLGNALRHQGAGTQVGVEVQVMDDANRVALTVVSRGSVTGEGAQEGSGTGIVGMRERVTSLGGDLDVVFDAASDVVTVSAVLPIDPARPVRPAPRNGDRL